MGTLNAVYIRSAQPVTTTIKAKERTGYTIPGSSFYAVDLDSSEFGCPEDEILQLSLSLQTDAIWITFQSTADVFVYHHCNKGSVVRSLCFGRFNEREWERIEGIPEPWENATFFDTKKLAFLLKYEKDKKRRDEIERFFNAGSLKLGSDIPGIDARESARAIATFFNLPGWQ